jgi:hypothetical protein
VSAGSLTDLDLDLDLDFDDSTEQSGSFDINC